MRTGELIEELKKFDERSHIYVVANNYRHSFEIYYGSSDGCTKENADCVYLSVESTNDLSEKEPK